MEWMPRRGDGFNEQVYGMPDGRLVNLYSWECGARWECYIGELAEDESNVHTLEAEDEAGARAEAVRWARDTH